MPDFQQNVTSGITPAPIQAPAPAQGDSTLGAALNGAATLINAGLQIKEQQKAEQKSESIQRVEKLAQQMVLESTERVQSGQSKLEVNLSLQKNVNNADLNTEERGILLDRIAELRGIKVGAGTSDQDELPEARIDRDHQALVKNYPEIAFAVSVDLGFDTNPDGTRAHRGFLTTEEQAKALGRAQEHLRKKLVADSLSEEADKNLETNVDLSIQQVAEAERIRIGQALSVAGTSIQALAREIGPNSTPEQIQTFEENRQGFLNLVSAVEERVEEAFGQVSIRTGGSKDAREQIKFTKQALLDRVEAIRSGIESESIDQFQQTANLLKWFEEKQQLEFLESYPIIRNLRAVFGDTIGNSLIQQSLTKNPAANAAASEIGSSALNEVLMTKGQLQGQKIKAVVALQEGRTFPEFDSDKREELALNYYTIARDYIEAGDFQGEDTDRLNSMGIAFAKVLDFSQETPSLENQKRSLDLMNSKNFQKFFEKLGLEEQQIVGRFGATFNQTVLSDRSDGIIKDLSEEASNFPEIKVRYSPEDGQFSAVVGPRTSVLRGTEGDAQLQPELKRIRHNQAKVDKLVKKANLALQGLTQFKAFDPVFKDKSDRQIRDFVVGTSPSRSGISVTAPLLELPAEEQEAQKRGIDLKTLNELKSVDQRQEKVKENITRSLLEVIQDAPDTDRVEARRVLDELENNTDSEDIQILRDNPDLTFNEVQGLRNQGDVEGARTVGNVLQQKIDSDPEFAELFNSLSPEDQELVRGLSGRELFNAVSRLAS